MRSHREAPTTFEWLKKLLIGEQVELKPDAYSMQLPATDSNEEWVLQVHALSQSCQQDLSAKCHIEVEKARLRHHEEMRSAGNSNALTPSGNEE